MPTVRQYQPNQVQTQVISGPQAQVPDSTTAALATGLRQVSGALSDVQQRMDESAAQEAAVAFERDKNDLFFNPETGYFNTQGRDAFDQSSATSKALEDLKRQYSDGLQSPAAKRAFDTVADAHITRAGVDIARHSSKHLQAWEVATINAQVENTIENATLYYNDDDRLGVQRALGRQSVLDAAEKEGVSAEVTRERLENYESSFARSVVSAATQSSSTEGEAALDKWEKSLEGPDLQKLKSQLATKKVTEKNAQDSRDAVIFATNAVDTFGDETNARSLIIDQVNGIEDADLRRKAMKESMWALKNKQDADAEERAGTFEQAENHVFNGGSIEAFKADNSDAWEKLTAKQKRSLESGENITTDYDAYYNLINQPVDKLAQTRVSDHFHQLNPAYRSKLQTAVNSAQRGLRDGETTRDVARKQRLQDITGIKSPKGKKQVQRYNALNRTLDSMIESKQKSLSRDFLTDEEYAEVLNNFSKTVVQQRSILGIGFESEQDLTDIDTENLEAYSAYLTANGIQVTSDTLLLVENNEEHKRAALEAR